MIHDVKIWELQSRVDTPDTEINAPKQEIIVKKLKPKMMSTKILQ